MKIESVGQGVSTAAIHLKNKQETVEKRASETGEGGKQPESSKPGIDASKQALNASILKASMEVSLSAGNKSMSLLFKTAIENINQALAPELGEDAICG